MGYGGLGLQGHTIHVGINWHFFLQKTNQTETLAVHCESQAGEYRAPQISLADSESVKNKMKSRTIMRIATGEKFDSIAANGSLSLMTL